MSLPVVILCTISYMDILIERVKFFNGYNIAYNLRLFLRYDKGDIPMFHCLASSLTPQQSVILDC